MKHNNYTMEHLIFFLNTQHNISLYHIQNTSSKLLCFSCSYIFVAIRDFLYKLHIISLEHGKWSFNTYSTLKHNTMLTLVESTTFCQKKSKEFFEHYFYVQGYIGPK